MPRRLRIALVGCGLWWLALGPIGCGEAARQTQDAGSDGGFVPYQPPPAQDPFQDVAFLQETNHTTDELEAGVGGLIWVGLPPAGLTGRYETPTQVTPRGLVGHDPDGTLRITEIPVRRSGCSTPIAA